MSTLNLFAFIIQMFWVPDLILCFSLWQIAFSKGGYRQYPHPTCSIYMWMMPLTRVGPFPHIWLGACDYSNPESEADIRLWNIWGYHRRDMTTTWFSWLRHLTLDPWRLCWGDRVKRVMPSGRWTSLHGQDKVSSCFVQVWSQWSFSETRKNIAPRWAPISHHHCPHRCLSSTSVLLGSLIQVSYLSWRPQNSFSFGVSWENIYWLSRFCLSTLSLSFLGSIQVFL